MGLNTPTPGPWRIEEPADDTYNDISIKHGARTVCRLWQEGRLGSPVNAEQWANARLIANAPCLLDFAEAVVRYAGNAGDDYLADKARTAIAKATGGDV